METPAMNADHPKRTGATLRSFEHSMSLIFAWAVVVAFIVVLFRSHWSFNEWLGEVFNVTWPLGLLMGLLSLLAANAYRRQKDSDGSYRFMRLAAIAFLAALVMLWVSVQYYL
jgi:Ca2+/Na+ antiporter